MLDGPLACLDDVEALRALKDSARKKVADALKERLPKTFQTLGWMKPKVGGKAGLVGPPITRWNDSALDLAFNVIPGGELSPGPSPRMRKLLETRRKSAKSGEERSLLDALLAMPRAKPVRIAPFVMAWFPLDADTIQALGAKLAPADLRGAPALVPTKLVAAIVAASGYALPTAHEWEWAYRGALDTLFFWGDDAPTLARFVATGGEPSTWQPALNAFGLMGMGGYPEVCAGDDGAPASVRGGAAPLHPWQGLGEELLSLGVRGDALPKEVAIRLVLRLDPAAAAKPAKSGAAAKPAKPAKASDPASAKPTPTAAPSPSPAKVTSFKVALKSPEGVVELVVREAKLKAFPKGLETLRDLQKLDVCGNAIEELPATLALLPALEDLDVSANPIKKAAKELARMPALRRLRIGSYTWRGGPPKAFDVLIALPSLAELDIHSQDNLKTLPLGLAGHPALRSLRLTMCRLPAFPEVVFDIPRLALLDLNSARFGGVLPTKVRGLRELRTLRLGGCDLTRLPRAFAELPALTELYLRDNSALVLGDELAAAKGLEHLHLGGVHTPLPAALGTLPRLRVLSLSNGACQSAPPFLAKLGALESLDVSNNDSLAALPDEVLGLPRLTKVICYNSGLAKKVPSLRARWPKLTFEL